MKITTRQARIGYIIQLVFLFAAVFSAAKAAPGDLDPTFAGTGRLKIGFNYGQDYGRASLIQPDGKIVVAGYARNAALEQMIICRYNPDGTLDPTFDGDGRPAATISPPPGITRTVRPIPAGDERCSLCRF